MGTEALKVMLDMEERDDKNHRKWAPIQENKTPSPHMRTHFHTFSQTQIQHQSLCRVASVEVQG